MILVERTSPPRHLGVIIKAIRIEESGPVPVRQDSLGMDFDLLELILLNGGKMDLRNTLERR